jgi:hypothetical protein
MYLFYFSFIGGLRIIIINLCFCCEDVVARRLGYKTFIRIQ